MDDVEIKERWLRASRLYHSKSHLARRIALREVKDMEDKGVTESDIDRIFPLSPMQIWLRNEFVDASID
jgi:hypothetical protein